MTKANAATNYRVSVYGRAHAGEDGTRMSHFTVLGTSVDDATAFALSLYKAGAVVVACDAE